MSRRLRSPMMSGVGAKLLLLLCAVIALFVVGALLPHPDVEQVRSWADSVGPWFPLVFFVAHALITVAPFPRTVFTLSAGVLFGPLTGILLAVSATTVSAALALLLVRAVGRDSVSARLTHPAIRSVDVHLARRGWLAVGSLRLIAPIPFSVINYCCGVSSIRLVPYLAATVVGVIPGTVGVVLLGDALTGRTDPALLVLSGICIAVGIAGLVLDARMSLDAPETLSTTPSSTVKP